MGMGRGLCSHGGMEGLGLVGAKPYSLKASSLKAHLGPLLAVPPAPKSLQLPEISVQTHESVGGCFIPKPWQQISLVFSCINKYYVFIVGI